MTDERLERALRAGPPFASSYPARIPLLERRRSRRREMSPFVFRAIAIALLVAGGGVAIGRFLGVGPNGAAPAPTPSPTASPTPTTRPAIGPADVGKVLPPGTYDVPTFAAPFTVTLPAGWVVQEFTGNNLVVRNGSTFLTLVVLAGTYSDPCHPDAVRLMKPGVRALLDALRSMARIELTGVRDASVGGASGKAFSLTSSVDTTAQRCSTPGGLAIGVYELDGSNANVLVGSAEANLPLWAIDAGATVLIGGPETIVDSIAFLTPSPT